MSRTPNSLRSRSPNLAGRRRNALLLIPAFVFIGLIWAGEVWLLNWIQASRCPTGAFLSTMPEATTLVMVLPPSLPAIGLGLIVANALTRPIPAVRRFFEQGQGPNAARGYRSGQVALLRITVAIAAIVLPLSLVAGLQQICLTPDGLFYRNAPWEGLREYPWSTVTGLTTGCWPSRGDWNTSYTLTFRDGPRVDVMGGVGSAWRARPQIVTALHGRPIEFDDSAVSARCGVAYRDMLTSPP
ncbi:MAG: hypothetical protein ACHP84_13250 [Caulobacterales bacterium]